MGTLSAGRPSLPKGPSFLWIKLVSRSLVNCAPSDFSAIIEQCLERQVEGVMSRLPCMGKP